MLDETFYSALAMTTDTDNAASLVFTVARPCSTQGKTKEAPDGAPTGTSDSDGDRESRN